MIEVAKPSQFSVGELVIVPIKIKKNLTCKYKFDVFNIITHYWIMIFLKMSSFEYKGHHCHFWFPKCTRNIKQYKLEYSDLTPEPICGWITKNVKIS